MIVVVATGFSVDASGKRNTPVIAIAVMVSVFRPVIIAKGRAQCS